MSYSSWELLKLLSANDNREPTPEEKAESREGRIQGIILPRLQKHRLGRSRGHKEETK